MEAEQKKYIIGLIILCVFVSLMGMMAFIIFNDVSNQNFLNEKKNEYNIARDIFFKAEKKMLDAKFRLEIYHNNVNTLKEKEEHTASLNEFKASYYEYVKAINTFNDEVKLIRAKIDDKGLYCNFCEEKVQEYKWRFD